jgi:hypothetical protein
MIIRTAGLLEEWCRDNLGYEPIIDSAESMIVFVKTDSDATLLRLINTVITVMVSPNHIYYDWGYERDSDEEVWYCKNYDLTEIYRDVKSYYKNKSKNKITSI